MEFRHAVLVAGVLAILAGCTRKQEQSASSTTTPPAEATSAGTTPPPGHEGATAQVSTEGSVADLIARINREEASLDQIIADAQLSSVHVKAFAVRDLAVAAADRAQLTGGAKATLDHHIDRIRSLAGALDEAGDAGDLSKTKARQAEFHTELQALNRLLGSAGR